jgi:hypothetical protein
VDLNREGSGSGSGVPMTIWNFPQRLLHIILCITYVMSVGIAFSAMDSLLIIYNVLLDVFWSLLLSLLTYRDIFCYFFEINYLNLNFEFEVEKRNVATKA